MNTAYYVMFPGTEPDAITRDLWVKALDKYLKKHTLSDIEHHYDAKTHTYAQSFVSGFGRYAKITYLKKG